MLVLFMEIPSFVLLIRGGSQSHSKEIEIVTCASDIDIIACMHSVVHDG